MSDKELIVIGDRVLIAPAGSKEKTATGLYLPHGVEKKEAVQQGMIVKVGPGYIVPAVPEGSEPWEESRSAAPHYIPLQVKEGDVAIFLRKEAIEIEYDGKEYLIVPHSAILTVVRDSLFSKL